MKRENEMSEEIEEVVVKEGVESYWNYHLAHPNCFTSLCGKKVMNTSIPLSAWDSTPKDYHIPESWCSKCAQIYLKDKATKTLLVNRK